MNSSEIHSDESYRGEIIEMCIEQIVLELSCDNSSKLLTPLQPIKEDFREDSEKQEQQDTIISAAYEIKQ